ncbi:MAG: hypothetical protein KF903_08945 [Dokdonella sp.]|uniref:hypothetical protein n=1 Tax=Dokdonella sp. TaxID=2291710 RepID=UPI0025C589E7|nr:hypothetical protein [Dokdonella sp.]MBX3701107.1 hypothetical protein [Dokdonella sp.]MCW5578279.1 hypothetical protein [Dokdonella sp.]
MTPLRCLRTRRWRLRLACLALFALLQQVAIAAWACPVFEQQPATPPAVAGHCHGEPAAPTRPSTDVLCSQHCQGSHLTNPDLRLPQVPPLALPPGAFALGQSLLPQPAARAYHDVPLCRSDPPPARRFCSLQI